VHDLVVEAEIVDGLDGGRGEGAVEGAQDLSAPEGDSTLGEELVQAGVERGSEGAGAAAGHDDGAVLQHEGVEVVGQSGELCVELALDPAGREHDGDARHPRGVDRLERLGVRVAVDGDRAVEVERDNVEVTHLSLRGPGREAGGPGLGRGGWAMVG
jgi:hypothetical protein